MRKQVITPESQSAEDRDHSWLNLDRTAAVEITSEDAEHPIEAALAPGDKRGGWRASAPGPQTIRLIFDEPQRLARVRLVFEETETERTQEFVVRWAPDAGKPFREIVRQQWNFSPPGTVREIEDYTVELPQVRILEVIIIPDKNGGEARASLASLRLA